jgi:hypothetical protein
MQITLEECSYLTAFASWSANIFCHHGTSCRGDIRTTSHFKRNTHQKQFLRPYEMLLLNITASIKINIRMSSFQPLHRLKTLTRGKHTNLFQLRSWFHFIINISIIMMICSDRTRAIACGSDIFCNITNCRGFARQHKSMFRDFNNQNKYCQTNSCALY